MPLNLGLRQPAAAFRFAACCESGPAGWLRKSGSRLPQSKLTALRDWLLPMLMNGQLRVG